MIRTLLLTFFFALPALACRTGDCEYYACKAQQLACPADSLLNETAHPYCVQFDRDRGSYSTEGQQALDKIKSCLQAHMEQTQPTTCPDAEKAFIDAHVACYPVSGYCELGWSDRFLIGKVAWGALFDARFREAALTIERICSER